MPPALVAKEGLLMSDMSAVEVIAGERYISRILGIAAHLEGRVP